MPTPIKPSNLRVISGTNKPSKEKQATSTLDKPLEEVPKAPSWLPNVHAVREWNRLAPILHRRKTLTESSLSGLATLCALHGKLVQIWAAGETPGAPLLAQYRGYMMEFALTPASAARVPNNGHEEDETENPFSRNGRRATIK